MRQKSSTNTLKELTYNDTNTSQNFGKLETATSSNYGNSPGPAVTVVKETYTYGDSAGRLTSKTTNISGIGASGRDVTQSYTYDDLDEVSDMAYPATASGSTTWSHLQPKHNYGFLTRLDADSFQPGFMPQSDVAYAASGAVNVLPHNNGVTDTYTPDPNGLARPQSIDFTGWSVVSCTVPTIGTIQSSNGTSLTYGQSTNLSISADGHGETPTYQWYLGGSVISGATLSSYTATPAQSSTYQVRVTNTCGFTDSAPLTITVQLHAPTGLAAQQTSSNSVTVSWQGSTGSPGYDLWRQSSGVWVKRNTTLITYTSYLDSVAADAAYVYHAFAVGTNFVSSGPSNNDVTSSYIFAPVSPGQQILFADFDAVLQHGINNLLIATGNPTRSWHDIDNVSGSDCTILAASDPNPVTHSPILGAQMLALRCAMNRALTSAGIPLTAYTDSSLGNVIIKAVHITELQNRTK